MHSECCDRSIRRRKFIADYEFTRTTCHRTTDLTHQIYFTVVTNCSEGVDRSRHERSSHNLLTVRPAHDPLKSTRPTVCRHRRSTNNNQHESLRLIQTLLKVRARTRRLVTLRKLYDSTNRPSRFTGSCQPPQALQSYHLPFQPIRVGVYLNPIVAATCRSLSKYSAARSAPVCQNSYQPSLTATDSSDDYPRVLTPRPRYIWTCRANAERSWFSVILITQNTILISPNQSEMGAY